MNMLKLVSLIALFGSVKSQQVLSEVNTDLFLKTVQGSRTNLGIFDKVGRWLDKTFNNEDEKEDDALMDEAKKDPDATRTIKEIIEARNLTFESHSVTTDDGYTLEMHRLFDSTAQPYQDKPVVFMQHGLLDTSEAFVMNEDESLAFGFAKLGYDVWLGNNRGGLYSKKHIAYNPYERKPEESGKFFDYSFYEMGKEDLPSQINYVLTGTHMDNLTYIGHSQGSTQMFSALAEGHGDLGNKINLFVATAPTVYMQNVENKVYKVISDIGGLLYDSFNEIHVYEIFGHKWHEMAPIVCTFIKDLCDQESVNGIPITSYVNEYRARVKNSREQPGASVKSLLHFTQLMKKDNFTQFDYFHGDKNKEHYNGQEQPPLIDLENIKNTNVPIAMFVGDKDEISDEADTKLLVKLLGPKTVIEYMLVKDFNHYSFNMFHPDNEDAINYLKTMVYYVHLKNPLPQHLPTTE